MTGREFRDRLSKRARKVGLVVAPELADKLWVYVQLLTKWNEKINLTAIDLADFTSEGIDRLLLEPLAAAALTDGARTLIDIGSGGGSPALPLALAMRAERLVMVEVKTRKSVFLREVARELGLRNATVVAARHETLLANPDFHEAFDLLSIRAVRVESRMFSALQAFISPGGRLFHFRAVASAQPLLPPPLELGSTHQLFDGSRSELAVIRKYPDVPRGTIPEMS